MVKEDIMVYIDDGAGEVSTRVASGDRSNITTS